MPMSMDMPSGFSLWIRLGTPVADTTISAFSVRLLMSGVILLQTVTVAFLFIKICITGNPTRELLPITTACLPLTSMPY
jgi:hypothetical protein